MRKAPQASTRLPIGLYRRDAVRVGRYRISSDRGTGQKMVACHPLVNRRILATTLMCSHPEFAATINLRESAGPAVGLD